MTQEKAPFTRNPPLTPEFKLVAACSWLPESGHTSEQLNIIESLSKCDLDWDEIASLVLRHGVVGQFCTTMGKSGWVNVPIATKESLKSCWSQHAVRSLGQTTELARVGRLFSRAGISLIPLKGVALSQELYGNPCIRSSVDLDILIKPKDIEKAEMILFDAGYLNALGLNKMPETQKHFITKSLPHHQYINYAKSVHIELHWRSFLWSNEQVVALWDTGRFSTWLNAGFMQLSTEDNILFLADHGSRHGWQSLKWLSDIAMLMHCLSEDEWFSLYKRAIFFDLQRVLSQTAILLEVIYGVKPSEKFKEIYTGDKIIQKLSSYVISQLQVSAEDITLRKWSFTSLRQALLIKRLKPLTPLSALLSGIIITPADFVELPLPDYLFWLYLPLRPYFWFRRHYLKKSKR